MITTEDRSASTSGMPGTGSVDAKLEVLIVPVSDADRAKEFYARLGWRLDAGLAGEEFRLIQFTPPGSGCSIQFGTNLTPAAPGSFQGSILAVSDIASTADLANAMRRASAAHGEHEKRIGAADPDWPDWYAAYMVAEQAGTELPR
jgi:catechol 2,3-dioxygenase-like lactoylglutathione lyase family enzyme